MTGKVCFFSKCHVPSKWKPYGVARKETVTYSKLLRQKKAFQHFIELDDLQISKSEKMASYCIIDQMYSPSKGNNIDIFIFDEAHVALYLEYSVQEQYTIKNCNELIAFLNFNKNSTIHLHSSFIYVKSADGFKWTLFFSVLEFLIKNLNVSIIGSQFYFPLFSKYLIMNEFRLLNILQNCWQSVNTNFSKAFSQNCEIFALRLKKVFSSGILHSKGKLQNPKNTSNQIDRKMRNLAADSCKSIPKLKLKRKSIDLCLGDDFLPKPKRFKNVCHCNTDSWKIFTSFKTDTILNYTSILEFKKWAKDPEAMNISLVDYDFKTVNMQYSKSSTSNQNQNELNLPSLALNTYEKSSQEQLLDKTSELINVIDISLKNTESKLRHISDFCTLKETKSISDNRECSTLDDINNFPLSVIECRNKESFQKISIPDKSYKIIDSPSRKMPPKSDFVRFNKHSLTFQTASGKSVKISETAFQAAQKMFEDISSENLDIFSQKNTQNTVQQKYTANNKHCVGFQTASGKSLHASEMALEAAEKMFKDVEADIFPEKLTQTQLSQNSKECYPNILKCEDEEISKVLAENFFEDFPFDEKEIDSKPTHDSETLSAQKQRIAKATSTNKIRKSLGGRRSLKPYTLKK